MGLLQRLFGGGDSAGSADELLVRAETAEDPRRGYDDLRRGAARFAAELGAGAPLHGRLHAVCRRLSPEASQPDAPAASPTLEAVVVDGTAIATFGALLEDAKRRTAEYLCLVFGPRAHGGSPVDEVEALLALEREPSYAFLFIGEDEILIRRDLLLRFEGSAPADSEDIAADLQDCARQMGLREGAV